MRYHIIFLLLSNIILSQQIQSVDFISVDANLTPNFIGKSIAGKVVYQFKVLKMIDTIKIDAVKMEFSDMILNGNIVKYKKTDREIKLFEGFKKGKNTLCFRYTTKPKQALYFIGNENNYQIWTQGQGKYTSHWFPSFDDVNEKLVFNMSIAYLNNFVVVSNGVLHRMANDGRTTEWSFKMQKPMPSYLLMMAVGKFNRTQLLSKTGKPLDFFVEPIDQAKLASTYIYSKQIFDFFEKTIGVEYPWQIYKQIPVRDFLYAGMENTSATIFARDYVVDPIGFNDKNYINVNAHELAHQWFGNLVTAKTGKHHWLQESFATYYALLAEKDIYGANDFNYKMYQTALQLNNASKTDTIPILNEKASTLSFYQKGAWALRFLEEEMGQDKFQKAVKNYLKKYKFKNIETDDFLAEVKKVSTADINKFKVDWLENKGFDFEKCKKLLAQNKAMQQYFEVLELSKTPFLENKNKYAEILKSNAFSATKELVIMQIRKIAFADKVDLLQLAMQTNEVQVRQAVAQYITDFPAEFKPEFDTFLQDQSYITQEIALTKLWQLFPEDRKKLLDKTKEWKGFNDLNLRILWLNLALQTDGYMGTDKITLYDELLQYATANYETETRQNALENLLYLNKNDENYLPSLINAATNFKWQFAGFARTKIRSLLKNGAHRPFFEKMLPTLPMNEKTLLEKLLNE